MRPTFNDQLLERSVGGRGDGAAVEGAAPRVGVSRAELFRERAVAVHLRGGFRGEPIRVAPPWATWLVLVLSALVVVAVVGAAVASVEVTSLGRGILQANGAPHVIASQIAGTVVSVSARAGDEVDSGQQIAQLESATTAAALLEASRKLDLAQRSLDHFRTETEPLLRARIAEQEAQVQTLAKRASSQRTSEGRIRTKTQKVQALNVQGIASDFDVTDAKEQAELARRNVLLAQQENSNARERVSATSAEASERHWQLAADVEEARARRDALQFALDAAVVRSPIRGVLGAVAIRPGDTVSVGGLVTRVVASGAPRRVVVYLPERDRAFVDVGARVRVEVDQLPFWEFGSFGATVTRVSSEIASARDLSDTLGDSIKLEEPMYRIDVELDDDERFRQRAGRLRPESLANVRFTLRKRRVLSVLFEPLRRWLG